MGLFEHKRILQFLSPTFKSEDSVKSAWLPDSGFYPKISGIFRAVGIFLGIKIWAKNLGKDLGISREEITNVFLYHFNQENTGFIELLQHI